MWSYFGSKTNIVDFYPKPVHDKIIEPFAGTAKYSLKYFDREVTLIDKYEVIIKIWKWLQKCSPNDITSLPRLKKGERVSDYEYDCEEAKLLMGFLVSKGLEKPRDKVTRWVYEDRPNHINFSLKKIASSLYKIKHWKIIHNSYEQVKNQEATWFIDPPYKEGGEEYTESSKKIDYIHLSNYCKTRKGQVIVCEKFSETWLPFNELTSHKGRNKKKQVEGIWTNYPTHYNNKQTKLF